MTEVQNDPDRVLHPLRRRGRRQFERVTWEEALDDIGARLGAIRSTPRRRLGRLVHGQPGRVQLLAPAVGQGLPRRARLAALLHGLLAGRQQPLRRQRAALRLAVPASRSPTSSAPTSCSMVGANPLVSHGSVLTAPRIRDQLHAIVDRGGRVVVVDPRRSETARAFEHLPIDPDADAWLLLSMLHVIFDEGLEDAARDRAPGERRRRSCARLRRARSRRRRPRRAPASPPTRVRALARDLAAAERRRRLRAHRLLPRPLRHARRLPARRAQRSSPATSTARAARCSATRRSPSSRIAEQAGARHLRQGPLADRRLPRRARHPAGVADGEGDHDAGRGPDPGAVRLRRQPGALGARRRRARGGARASSTSAVALDLYVTETAAPRRLRAPGDDLPRARGRPAAVPRPLHDAVHPDDRGGRRAARRGAPGVGGHRRDLASGSASSRRASWRCAAARQARPAAVAAAAGRPAAAHRPRGRPVRPAPRRAQPRRSCARHPHGIVLAEHLAPGCSPQADPPPRASGSASTPPRSRAEVDAAGGRETATTPSSRCG